VPIPDHVGHGCSFLRLKAAIHLPLLLDVVQVLPISNRQSCQISRTDRRHFRHLWTNHFCIQNIGLELHQQVVRGCPTIYTKLRDFFRGICFHSSQHFHGLVGNGFQCCTRTMGVVCPPGQPENGTPCIVVPVWCTKAGKS